MLQFGLRVCSEFCCGCWAPSWISICLAPEFIHYSSAKSCWAPDSWRDHPVCRRLPACTGSHGIHCPRGVGARVHSGTARGVEECALWVHPCWYWRHRSFPGRSLFIAHLVLQVPVKCCTCYNLFYMLHCCICETIFKLQRQNFVDGRLVPSNWPATLYISVWAYVGESGVHCFRSWICLI